jgi:hypothetical protein
LAIQIASEGRCGAERPSTRTWQPSTQVDDQPKTL